jgi:hypothetical protein
LGIGGSRGELRVYLRQAIEEPVRQTQHTTKFLRMLQAATIGVP